MGKLRPNGVIIRSKCNLMPNFLTHYPGCKQNTFTINTSVFQTINIHLQTYKRRLQCLPDVIRYISYIEKNK